MRSNISDNSGRDSPQAMAAATRLTPVTQQQQQQQQQQQRAVLHCPSSQVGQAAAGGTVEHAGELQGGGGALLRGSFDEAAAHSSFLEALNEWRTGGTDTSSQPAAGERWD
jgi:hypothetical protein